VVSIGGARALRPRRAKADRSEIKMSVNRPAWVKSTFSQASDCVEWALDPDQHHILLRDSKDPHGDQLRFTLSEWRAFVSGVAAGEAQF
jgi:hypothetical protein